MHHVYLTESAFDVLALRGGYQTVPDIGIICRWLQRMRIPIADWKLVTLILKNRKSLCDTKLEEVSFEQNFDNIDD